MFRRKVCYLLIILLLLAGPVVSLVGAQAAGAIGGPSSGRLYLGAYPYSPTGEEDDITAATVSQFESLVGKRLAWVYFSNDWYRSRHFPRATAEWIRSRGSIPFIRLMLRTAAEVSTAPDPVYTPQAIINGVFDQDLRTWAQEAHAFGTPVLVEYGTECNGFWFPWNGAWNGQGATTGFGNPALPDGPERFVAAYRHIVTLMRQAGATNLTWVFHVANDDDPEVSWNRLERYYPGDDVVDWVGVSIYGAQSPSADEQPEAFRSQMDRVYPRLTALAPSKPVMVLEFGCAAGNPSVRPESWTQAALADLLTLRWPAVGGFAWWNSRWSNDDDPAHDTTMRLQDIPALAAVFKQMLVQYGARVQERIPFTHPDLAGRNAGDAAFLGMRVYNQLAGQTVTRRVSAGGAAIYQFSLLNAGTAADTIRISRSSLPSGWSLRCFNALTGGQEITAQVNSGWLITGLAPRTTREFRVELRPGSTIQPGASVTLDVTALSMAAPQPVDVMRLVTTMAPPLTAVSLGAVPMSPQRVNTAITLAATPTGGGRVEYRFLVGAKNLVGVWQYTLLREYAFASTCRWQPARAGEYRLQVYAREAGCTAAYQRMATISFRVMP